MKLLPRRSDIPDVPDDTEGAEPKPTWGMARLWKAQRGPWQSGNQAGTKLFLVLLVGALLTGPAAIGMTLMNSSRPATVTAPDATDQDTGGAVAGAETKSAGFAETLVTSWLSAGREDIARLNELLVTPADEMWLPAERPKPAAAVIANRAQPTGGGRYWKVEVFASGGVAGGGETYRVLVDMDLSNPRALTLPAIVANPAAGESADPIPVEALQSAHGAVKAADGFGRALLTKETDLERWTAPDADIAEVSPAPCSDLSTAVAAATPVSTAPAGDEEVTVLATYTCSQSGEVARAIQYLLVLQGRDGRWEVSALDDRLDPDSTDNPSAAPTTQPSTTPTPPG